MKKYRHAKVALLIGLLSLNTLSACVNIRQTLAMRRPSLSLKSDFIQGRLRRSYCRWAGVITFFAVNLGIILVIIEMTPVSNTALLNGNSSMVTTLSPHDETMSSILNKNLGNGSGMFIGNLDVIDHLDGYATELRSALNHTLVRSKWNKDVFRLRLKWKKRLLRLKWMRDLLTSEWMKDLFRSNTNSSNDFISP